MLLHELAHIRRGDAFVTLAAEIARVVYWFHPLAHACVRRITAEAERACDDAVVAAGISGTDFAADLIAIATKPLNGLHSSAASRRTLEERVQALVTDRMRTPPPRRARVLVAATLVLVTAGIALLRFAAPWSHYGVAPEIARAIAVAALRERIEIDLAFALVQTESGFRTHVVSPRGAVGLTQILPSSARLIAPSVTAEELMQPSTNLGVGFRLLRSHLDRYGDVVTALEAYSRGTRAVDRDRAAAKPLPASYARQVLAAR